MMAAAYANQSKRISKGKAEKIIRRTKWQYAAGPTRQITASGLMKWTDSGEFLCLTEDGREDYETFIQAAEEASQ